MTATDGVYPPGGYTGLYSRSHFVRVYFPSVSLVFLRPRLDSPETMDEQPADITAYPVPAVAVARSELNCFVHTTPVVIQTIRFD